jgi:hypothetical protein
MYAYCCYTVTSSFNFVAAAKHQAQPYPAEKGTWEDHLARSLNSIDGYQSIHYLPGLMGKRGVVSAAYRFTTLSHILFQKNMTGRILEYAKVVPPQVGKDAGSKICHYIDNEGGGVNGIIRCVKGWHGIGQGVSPFSFQLFNLQFIWLGNWHTRSCPQL